MAAEVEVVQRQFTKATLSLLSLEAVGGVAALLALLAVVQGHLAGRAQLALLRLGAQVEQGAISLHQALVGQATRVWLLHQDPARGGSRQLLAAMVTRPPADSDTNDSAYHHHDSHGHGPWPARGPGIATA